MAILFGTSNLRMVRGLTWTDALQIKNVDGTIADLTSATFIMRVRAQIEDTSWLLELSSVNARLSSPAPLTGIVAIVVSADDTLLLPENAHEVAVYYYDLVALRPGTPQIREALAAGVLIVFPQVTRSWLI